MNFVNNSFIFWLWFGISSSSLLLSGYFLAGWNWFVYFYTFFTLQAPNGPIFPITIVMAWVTFLGVLIWKRALGIRGFIVAGCAPFGGAGLFELVYQAVGSSVQPSSWYHAPLMSWLSLLAWIAVGLTGIFFWTLNRVWIGTLGAFVVLFVLWTVTGYQTITLGGFDHYPLAYFFNSSLKIVSFLIFLLPFAQFKGPK